MPRWLVIALFGLALIAGARSLDSGFVHDDFSLVAGNRDLSRPGGWTALATAPLERWMGPGYPFYRPVAMLSYGATVALAGPGPRAHHTVNLLVHALATLALAALALALGEEPRTAALAAALFALHPAHAEAIAWISARADLLCALFALTAWRLSLLPLSPPAPALAFLAALASKESAAALPLALAASRNRLRVCIALFATLALWMAIRAFVIAGPPPALRHQMVTRPAAEQARALAALALELAAHGAGAGTGRLDYTVNRLAAGPSTREHALGAVALVLLAALALADLRRSRSGAVPWLAGFTASFAPLAGNLLRSGTALFALRYYYLPSAFLCLGIARGGRSATVGVACLAILWGARLQVELAPFASAHALWAHEEAVSPAWPVAPGDLGQALLAEHDAPAAEDAFRRSLALSAREGRRPPENLFGLARARLAQGDRREAEALLLEAHAAAPEMPRLAANLGFFYLTEKKPERARPFLEEALRLDPEDRVSRENLALLH